MLAGQERPGEIDVDDLAPDGRVETIGAVIELARLDRGVGHDGVEPAEASCSRRCRERDVVLDADVGHERDRIASGRSDERDRVGRRSLVDVDHGDARALQREANRGRAPDAASRAGDHGAFADESHGVVVDASANSRGAAAIRRFV